jgi:hypothetical protein
MSRRTDGEKRESGGPGGLWEAWRNEAHGKKFNNLLSSHSRSLWRCSHFCLLL